MLISFVFPSIIFSTILVIKVEDSSTIYAKVYAWILFLILKHFSPINLPESISGLTSLIFAPAVWSLNLKTQKELKPTFLLGNLPR